MPGKQTIELHFQEGFSGQDATVAVDGRIVERFSARTRPQIGAAHVATLSVSAGQSVEIRAGTAVLSFRPDGSHPHYLVRLHNNALAVRPSAEMPRYM